MIRPRIACLAAFLAISTLLNAADSDFKPHEYTPTELKDSNAIACWQFKNGHELEDSTPNNHALKLRGTASINPNGIFGAALHSTDTKNDKPQGASAGKNPAFSPKGAFSIDMLLRTDENAHSGATILYLIDKKVYHYAKDLAIANCDFCFYLMRNSDDSFYAYVSLGFGTDSVWAKSTKIKLPIGEWHQLAFSYDGKGIIRIFHDKNQIARSVFPGRGPVKPGNFELTIGDRSSSLYNSFPGDISQVRFCNGLPPEFGGKALITARSGRTVFSRLEKNAALSLNVINDTPLPISNIYATINIEGHNNAITIPDIKPAETRCVPIPVDSSLKPDKYNCSITLNAKQNNKPLVLSTNLTFNIISRENPFMPVIMWGNGDIDTLKYVGFTHAIHGMGDCASVWKAGKPIRFTDTEDTCDTLNKRMLNGLHVTLTTGPGWWIARYNNSDNRFTRVNRDGTFTSTTNPDVADPAIQQFGFNVGASIAKTYGNFPFFDSALIHSEVRDSTALSFRDFDIKSAKDFLGYDIPPQAVAKNGVHYLSLNNFPINRVIPDADPILRFYTWFWKYGDGWNPLHTQVSNGLKSTGRKDFWTFFDPAVRVPDVWGSGGDVDVISQWTYSYPDPIKIGQATDELFAMAEGTPGQKVMKMTQIIWYRSGTAPIDKMPKDTAKRTAWEQKIPDAQFITIAPDHISIALWSMIARPVRGIMYHGMGSLFDVPHGSYRHTNPETAKRLSKLLHDIIQPLGPSLLHIPDAKTDVAILESFASQMFTQSGSYGWSNSWEADMHLIAQWAGLQPQVVLDETVIKNGLGQFKLLFMPNCPVLTENVTREIKDFQDNGGIIIADQNLCPAITPDIIINKRARLGKADIDKAELQKIAANLSQTLAPFYSRTFTTNKQDLVPRLRKYKNADYLFVINDKRTYGDYVGQYGLVMEKGLLEAGTVSINTPHAHVYDLVASTKVNTTTTPTGTAFNASFNPGEGKLFLILSDPVDNISVTLPKQVNKNEDFNLTVQINDKASNPIQAVIPLQITITDPLGRTGEFSGYHAAVDGKLLLTLNIAPNDLPGIWKIQARELASGLTTSRNITVY